MKLVGELRSNYFRRKESQVMSLRCRFAMLFISLMMVSLIVRAQDNPNTAPLVRVLQAKGVLTKAEARSITASATPAEQRDRLAALLRDKGVISTAEFEAVRTTNPSPTKTITADYKPTSA